MSPPKSCMVCGDKALGYNFNAVTCESCKAFFRRNALAKKQFTCPFNQNCEITVVTRRFCQKCRLKKCLDIGMKSENIMSDEDKLIKRRKIESNRAKRKTIDQKPCLNKNISEVQAVPDSSGIVINDTYTSYDSLSCGSFESSIGHKNGLSTSTANNTMSDILSETMTGSEIVEFIVCDPDRASQAINKLMRTPAEALNVMEKIINSQSDALRLISHLIAYPGDALKIISKIMNSPFDALTVFTKFMSSPTDALEIISKVVSSPQDVLQFTKQLMDSPEDALDIMNKFMNTPAEALKIINKIINGSNILRNEELKTQNNITDTNTRQYCSSKGENILIESMLNSTPVSRSDTMETVRPVNSDTLRASLAPMGNLTSSPHYSSSTNKHDVLLDTVIDVVPTTQNILETEFPTVNFDNRTFVQTSFPDNTSPPDNTHSLETVLTEVIRIEYETYKAVPQDPCIKQEDNLNGERPLLYTDQQLVCSPSTIVSGRDLNEVELLKLRELKIASEALYYPVDEDLNELVMDDVRIKPEDAQQDPKLLQVINLTAVAIKRLIKMAKKITAFRNMCQEDQVALLKGGCTEMMIMRSVMTYDDNRKTWKIPHTKEDMSNIRAEVLKVAKGNLYEELLQFVRTFDEKWRMDENIILIMCAIVLFTPNRSRIIHSDVIKLEQNSYYYLLRRYLESVYTGCEAKSTFIKLIQKISDVERLNQVIIGVYLNVNPSQVEPLLREIFDLKNH